MISANADDKFFGRFTAAIDTHDGETEVEVEEIVDLDLVPLLLRPGDERPLLHGGRKLG